jgi:hypothetical protein
MAVSFRAFVSAGKISRGGNIAPRDVDTASHVDLFSLLPQRAEDKSIARAHFVYRRVLGSANEHIFEQ